MLEDTYNNLVPENKGYLNDTEDDYLVSDWELQKEKSY